MIISSVFFFRALFFFVCFPSHKLLMCNEANIDIAEHRVDVRLIVGTR